MLADTHCHLDFNLFDTDRDSVLDRARNTGIGWILNPGIDLPSSRIALSLAERYPEVFAAVGVHPNSALSWSELTKDELKELAAHPKVVAIGEIGLDYYRDHSPRQLQLDVFNSQLELAAEMNLPVVIHNRKAASDILSIIQRWCIELDEMGSPLIHQPGVLHSFSDDKEIAKKAISNNFMIGLTGPITFTNAIDLQNTVSSLPIDNIIIETDSPFLTPHPYRGSRNEPAYVRLIGEKLAQLQRLSLDVVEEITAANSDRLFNWRESG